MVPIKVQKMEDVTAPAGVLRPNTGEGEGLLFRRDLTCLGANGCGLR